MYIGVIVEMLKTSYSWTLPFIIAGNWAGLWTALTALVFGKIIAKGLVFAILVAIFTKYIADREIRKNNVKRNQ
jgi:branched-subunit amino acid transport protein